MERKEVKLTGLPNFFKTLFTKAISLCKKIRILPCFLHHGIDGTGATTLRRSKSPTAMLVHPHSHSGSNRFLWLSKPAIGTANGSTAVFLLTNLVVTMLAHRQ